MARIAALALVAWWIATPAVCSAFLLRGDCTELQASQRIEPAHAAPPPCHGSTPSPGSEAPAPADPADDSCCLGIQIAATSAAQPEADTSTAPPALLPAPAVPREWTRAAPVFPRSPDSLRSPYLRHNPPLLN